MAYGTEKNKYKYFEKATGSHNRKIKCMEYELSKAHSETVTMRKYWSEIMDDLEKEHRKEVLHLPAENERLKKENLKLATQYDEMKDKYRERNRDFYTISAELLEEQEKNKKLTAQVNRDFENSSRPSSMQSKGSGKFHWNDQWTLSGVFFKNRSGEKRNHKGTHVISCHECGFYKCKCERKSAQVLVLASPSANRALYIAREKKGHEGVKGTPLENYVGPVVHDHDPTFYSYGTKHQECIQHDCRYLTGSHSTR